MYIYVYKSTSPPFSCGARGAERASRREKKVVFATYCKNFRASRGVFIKDFIIKMSGAFKKNSALRAAFFLRYP